MRWLILLMLIASQAYALNVDRLQKALDKAREENNVSAMQMTLIVSSQPPVTLTSGYTQKKPNSPAITPATLFQIGSETKSFTAALILKLEMENKLKLSDPLSKYFPEYKKWANVTIGQMLHNNSGIPSYSLNKEFQEKIQKDPNYQWTPKELVAIATKLPNDFRPGEGWKYSNTNYILAGMIAEQVTKKSLDELYQSYFINKTALNLTQTYYLPTNYPDNIIKQMAHGYDDQDRDVTYDNMSWAGAAGAIVSTSNDLAKWAYDLFHNKVFPAKTLERMMTVVSTTSGLYSANAKEGYGLGIGTRTTEKYGKWWGHEGETLGYHAIFIWFPDSDLTAAILANGEATKLRDFAVSLPGLI